MNQEDIENLRTNILEGSQLSYKRLLISKMKNKKTGYIQGSKNRKDKCERLNG